MKYEVVTLPAKSIVGFTARTSNTAPDMGAKIGGLWQRLFGENIPATLQGNAGPNTYGLYTNYASDVNGEYDVLAGCEVVEGSPVPQGMQQVVIPAGKYAKFSYEAEMKSGSMAIPWGEIWATPLNRAYTVDFEEYLPHNGTQTAPVNIYIALAG